MEQLDTYCFKVNQLVILNHAVIAFLMQFMHLLMMKLF